MLLMHLIVFISFYLFSLFLFQSLFSRVLFFHLFVVFSFSVLIFYLSYPVPFSLFWIVPLFHCFSLLSKISARETFMNKALCSILATEQMACLVEFIDFNAFIQSIDKVGVF